MDYKVYDFFIFEYLVFLNCFLIIKNCFLFFKNKETKENMENTFGSLFFTIQKNIENTKLRKQKKFSKNTISKIVFSLFLKIVIKNSFQK